MHTRPNILLVMVDDMGFSDLGCYGGEIRTPTLDRLAGHGVRFTRFYNCARCCPTRASLLTGLYPHQAGIGHMTSENERTREFNAAIDDEAYEGWLNDRCVTIAEVLRGSGYRTYMSGKWHVGTSQPNWPVDRGFERYFGIIGGACNYFRPQQERQLREGTERVEPWPGFYTTDAFSEYAVRCIDEHDATDPFFLYLAYNAPHWPLHAWPKDIERYRGRYLIGWDELRERRFARQKETGLFDRDTRLSPRDVESPAWDEIDNKDEWDLRMAVYAAMIDSVDQGLARVVESLERTGQFENTLIMFLDDNGACAESFNTEPDIPPGPEESSTGVWLPWANASNTPFRLFKHFAHEGGINTPMIAHWPAGITARIERDYAAHVKDVMATCLELAGVSYPSEYNGRPILPTESSSLAPVLAGPRGENPEPIYWEHEGNRAVRDGRWKLVSYYGEAHGFGSDRRVGAGCRVGPWELYDTAVDPTELDDLSSRESGRAARMMRMYDEYAERTGVIDWETIQRIHGTCP